MDGFWRVCGARGGPRTKKIRKIKEINGVLVFSVKKNKRAFRVVSPIKNKSTLLADDKIKKVNKINKINKINPINGIYSDKK